MRKRLARSLRKASAGPARGVELVASVRSSKTRRVRSKPSLTRHPPSGKASVHPRPPGSETAADIEYNTISPVVCNGKQYATKGPFLDPPFGGWVSLYSVFDHDSPDFYRDGEIVVANGMTVYRPTNPDPQFGTASDFPAYWSDALRQYVYYDGHNGYDYGLSYQPVYAAAKGRVIYAAWNSSSDHTMGYGKVVMIDHGNGYVTLYGHLSKLMVHVGQRVTRDQEIGISGNTGHSSGPHLHFTVFHNCKPTDPYGWVGAGGDPLAGYQGETSAYLWRHVPWIDDPLPGFPGLKRIPPPPVGEIANLAIPRARTLIGLLQKMDAARRADARALRRLHIRFHYDWRAAAFRIPTPVRPVVLYHLPSISTVNVAAPITLYESQQSYTERLARLAPARFRGKKLVGGSWRAFILKHHHQLYLFGRGPAHYKVELRIPHSSTTPVSAVSNGGGSFAVPLTSEMSRPNLIQLSSTAGSVVLHAPRHHPHRRSKSDSQPAPTHIRDKSHVSDTNTSAGHPAVHERHAERRVHSTVAYLYIVGPAAAILVLVTLLALVFRRQGGLPTTATATPAGGSAESPDSGADGG